MKNGLAGSLKGQVAVVGLAGAFSVPYATSSRYQVMLLVVHSIAYRGKRPIDCRRWESHRCIRCPCPRTSCRGCSEHRGRLHVRARGRVVRAHHALHDVELSARRPARLEEVEPHHPERRPEPLPGRNLGPHFVAPTHVREEVLRSGAGHVSLDSPARPFAGAVPALVCRGAGSLCGDDQVATLLLRVGVAVRVVLPLVVAPPVARSPAADVDVAPVADVVRPLLRVDVRAVGAVELVGP